ncbi:MAG: exodeoxyribonuclease VII large subunit [Mariniblastus sp.]|jgi:exodeoxyribonuclease VII large subunit
MSKSKAPTKAQSVSQLSQAIKNSLNSRFPTVWVAGEISGMTQASSGHVYLTLKDQQSQINGIIWRSEAEKLDFAVKNGMEVECIGSVDVYPQRGTYQLIIRKMKPKGVGANELAFRRLHAKLSDEGLFDPSHKRELPAIPKHVAVITSPTGAAIRDFLQVLTRRWDRIRVTVVPVKVQGPGAAAEIAAAVRICNRMQVPLDAIVVTRGGGSVEDLWSFNEEIVVRAIFDSEIPVVSGVGHEIDVTLSDLVADVRALTPSEAAERLVPNFPEVDEMLVAAHQRMTQLVTSRVRDANQRLESLASRPVITQPLERIRNAAMGLDQLERDINRAATAKLESTEGSIKEMVARMNAINPLAVLTRGYSVTTGEQGELISGCESVKPGGKILTRLVDGTVFSRVEKVQKLDET